MDNCLLCLEMHNVDVENIKVNSSQWQELNIESLIEKHLWTMPLIKLTGWICNKCWEQLNDFHNFYVRVQDAHTQMDSIVKMEISNETETLMLETFKTETDVIQQKYIKLETNKDLSDEDTPKMNISNQGIKDYSSRDSSSSICAASPKVILANVKQVADFLNDEEINSESDNSIQLNKYKEIHNANRGSFYCCEICGMGISQSLSFKKNKTRDLPQEAERVPCPNCYEKVFVDDDNETPNNIYHICSHRENSQFQCKQFTDLDYAENRRLLYKHTDKKKREKYLTKLIVTKNPSRRQKNKYESIRENSKTSKFYLLKNGKRELVCKENFIKELSITRRRVDYLLKRIYHGETLTERRGGDHRSQNFIAKKEKCQQIINTLPAAAESTYNRS